MPQSNGKPPSHTDRIRELALYIEDSDDVSTVTENHIHVNLVDQTGKHQALMETRPENPRPKQDSLPEKVIDTVPEVIERAKTGPQAAVAVAIVVSLAAVAIVWLIYG